MMIRWLRTGYGAFDARHAVGPAAWPHFDLLWIHGGEAVIRFMDGPVERFGAGQGVLIYPDTRFAGHATTPQARVSIQHFALTDDPGPALPLPVRDLVGRRRGYTVFRPWRSDYLATLIDRAMQLSQAAPSSPIDAMRLALLALTLGELEMDNLPAAGHDRLEDLLEDLQERPQADWSLPVMAERVGLSVSHFRALFRERLGVSPGRYRQELRMRSAAALLCETGLPIKQIAAKMGFSDLPHFHREFKRAYGQTPRAYRDSRSPPA